MNAVRVLVASLFFTIAIVVFRESVIFRSRPPSLVPANQELLIPILEAPFALEKRPLAKKVSLVLTKSVVDTGLEKVIIFSATFYQYIHFLFYSSQVMEMAYELLHAGFNAGNTCMLSRPVNNSEQYLII